ncbi:MAG: hypothetical protein GSR85_01475 [Desulfurococcales archaeon]|nr:hypothetical protein [Desulfurococcales archaeon]
MDRSIDELERLADRKTREFDKLYLKVPKHKRKQAYQIFIDVAEGRITYKQALRKLRELAG